MGTVKETYVSFELAKLLKEKGFDEPCRARYDNNGALHYEKYPIDVSGAEIHNSILCPTHQMVMTWLREVHSLYIEVSLSCDREDKNAKIFDASIFNVQNQRYKKLSNIQGYEQACEAGCIYVLKNLI